MENLSPIGVLKMAEQLLKIKAFLQFNEYNR